MQKKYSMLFLFLFLFVTGCSNSNPLGSTVSGSMSGSSSSNNNRTTVGNSSGTTVNGSINGSSNSNSQAGQNSQIVIGSLVSGMTSMSTIFGSSSSLMVIQNKNTVKYDLGSLTPDENGWVVISSTSTMLLKMRYYYSPGNPILPGTGTAAISIWNQNIEQATSRELIGNFQNKDPSTNLSVVVTLDITENYSLAQPNSFSLTGYMQITELNMPTMSMVLSNMTLNNGIFTAGTITATIKSLTFGWWSISKTFNSDSSGYGSMTGPGYYATIVYNANGTGSYMDSSGKHYF